MTIYDRIGRSYRRGRRADPRWAASIEAALGPARSIVNVGAGAGSYEPRDRGVVAVEPSEVMIRQRPRGSAPVIRGCAERLPVRDGAVDAAMALLTIHHWTDVGRGLAELRRVADRQVLLTFDPSHLDAFWFVRDYLPELVGFEQARTPTPAEIGRHLRVVDVQALPVPRDMVDGVLPAYWARPEALLDPEVRSNMSSLAQMDQRLVDRAVARLAEDLNDGTWYRRNAELEVLDQLEAGFRLVIAGG
jgi:SAM-dependent methyltransferase